MSTDAMFLVRLTREEQKALRDRAPATLRRVLVRDADLLGRPAK